MGKGIHTQTLTFQSVVATVLDSHRKKRLYNLGKSEFRSGVLGIMES